MRDVCASANVLIISVTVSRKVLFQVFQLLKLN